MRFIHLRALPQLRARFGAYKHLWKKDLFTTLEEWTPQSQDAYFSIRVRNLRHSHPEWISLLDRRGYPKAKTGDPNARYVQFSSTECQELLRFLVWCLRRAIQQAESNNLDIVISNILIVHAIVQDDAIESLFTRTSLHNILRSEEKHPAVEQFRTSDDGFIELHEQNEDEEDERQEIESIEADDAFRTYPRRYFKAITAWCAATAYFFRPNARVTSGTFELLIFRKAKPRSEASLVEAHDFLRHRLETRWSADDLKLRLAFLQQKFDQKKTMQFTSYVHAEAAIMVYHCNRDKQDIMPVGVSKKCCYLCFRLRQHLEEHGWGKIWVAGTHGIIYEWSPPPFNIPTAVLRNLEDELLVVLWREAEQYLYRQSLPNTPDNQYHVISTWVDEWD
ncbi:hypothetical protein DL96DRAFT_1250528 [Flagelloscypha sp. PMI_526]|nr:hypothetical protein DL96DRAFT_1250528 [Flagelloscypha sp. PMI_526]